MGFAVLYRWRVASELADEFTAAWAALTVAIRAERGGLGSRLHRLGDDWWAAYAQWPSRAVWEASRERDSADPAASAVMARAIVESREPLLMEPVHDLLTGV